MKKYEFTYIKKGEDRPYRTEVHAYIMETAWIAFEAAFEVNNRPEIIKIELKG